MSKCGDCKNNGLGPEDVAMVDDCEECGGKFYLDCESASAGTCGCCMGDTYTPAE